MLNKLKAWMQLIKLGPVLKLAKETNAFFKQIVLKTLVEEGWFTFLASPRTVEDMATHFNYTDRALLGEILEILVQDKIIKGAVGTYFSARPVVTPPEITARLLSPGNASLSRNYVKNLSRRLQGKYYSYTSGFNLFNFDEALSSDLYRVIRKAIMAFSGILREKGRFLDVGTGSGIEISHIVAMYLHQALKDGNLENAGSIEFHSIDVDVNLIKIASEEFHRHIEKEIPNGADLVQKNPAYKPQFKVGTATKIPYPDKYFDIVYISQVLHWTDPALAIRELYRVTRDGGKVIGGQVLRPQADVYLHLAMQNIEGAHGFFSKQEMKQWVQEAGFKQATFATPVTTFVLRK